MKFLRIILLLAYFIVLIINTKAQTNSIVIGEVNENVYIIENEEFSQETPNYGNNYSYIDIDNNGIIDMTFDFHSHGNGYGGQGGVKVSCDDNTMVNINPRVVQFIGPCDDRYPDTTQNVHKLSMGDILSSTDYYQTSDHILYLSTWSYPCTIVSDIDDWEDGTYYLGFKKIINDTTHFGWVKMEESGKWKITFKELAFTKPIPQRKYPIINEFLSRNTSNIQDEYGEYEPWIELYNPHEDSIYLGNLSMTDQAHITERWYLPDIYMDSKEYLIIWADKDTYQGPFHANFDLRYANNLLSLYDINGIKLDNYYYHNHIKNQSEGRYPNASIGAWSRFIKPTPGESNDKAENIIINEFMAKNTSTIADENGEYNDWIELFNKGEDSACIADLYLTDDLQYPKKWKLPDKYIQAGGYLIVWADNQPEQGDLHANFKLDDDGEQLALFGPDGKTYFDNYTFSNQSPDISEGKFPNGSSNWAYFSTPTPGAFNTPNSVGENEVSNLKVFPNPTHGNIIYFNKEVSCIIYNSKGRLLINKVDIKTVDISRLQNGLYLLVTDEGEKIKLIKSE